MTAPGDKSISHRAAMMLGISNGSAVIDNFSPAADCFSTLEAMRSLGVEADIDGLRIHIKGRGKHGLSPSKTVLDCGNSGTTARLLSGILAGQPFDTTLIGDHSLSSRPMKRIIAPLTEMGALITSSEEKLPITISGGHRMAGKNFLPSVASAQVKSCILLAGLYADGMTSVTEATVTRDHTERMLAWLSAAPQIAVNDGITTVSVDSTLELIARDIFIPGDMSSAAFFIGAAAILPGSHLMIENVGINGARTGMIDALSDLGISVNIVERRISCNEPVANIEVEFSHSARGGIIRGERIASLIDEVPILAVIGSQLPGGIEIRDAAELRVKETDRISAVAENLRRMNISVTEYDDGIKIEQGKLIGAEVDSFGDHRIAMAFAVAALAAEGESTILNADAVDVSYPGFFQQLEALTQI